MTTLIYRGGTALVALFLYLALAALVLDTAGASNYASVFIDLTFVAAVLATVVCFTVVLTGADV